MAELIVREIKEHELGHAASLVAGILSEGQPDTYRSIYDRYAKRLPTRPRNTPYCYRGVVYKNQIVSLIHTIDFSLHYGRAVLNVVGIGIVCTHPRYRHQGYASALIKDTLTYAAEQGAHLVILNSTIPDYFLQFGFSPVWAQYSLQAPAQLASELEQPLDFRIATPADLPVMEKLYNRYWGTRVTAERQHVLWRWRMEHGRGQAALMVNKSHQVEGYIWHLPDDFSARNEVIATTPNAIATVLAYSGRRWLAAGHEHIVWSIPPDDVIIPFAQQMIPATLSASYHPTGGWLSRVIDSNAFLQELLPEITAQAKATYPEFDEHDLILTMTPDGVDIGLQSVPASHCHLSLRDFIQLVFGSLRPEALAIRQKLTRASVNLLEGLFPQRVAALAGWDWF